MEQVGTNGASDQTIIALSFEEALRELEQVVRRLEGGDAPLGLP